MEHLDDTAGSEAGSSAGGRIVVKLKLPKSSEEDSPPSPPPEIAPAEEIKTHVCKECGRSFSSGKALGGHMSSAHVQASKDYAFKNLKSKMKHKSGGGASAEQNACMLCGKAFPSKKSLFGHMRCHPDREWRGMDPPEQQQPGYECFGLNRETGRGPIISGPAEAAANELRWPVAVKRSRCPLRPANDDVEDNKVEHAAYGLLRLLNTGRLSKGKQINGGDDVVVEDGGPNKKQKKDTDDQDIDEEEEEDDDDDDDDDDVELRGTMKLSNYNGKGKEKMDCEELRGKVENNGKGKEKMDCEAVDYLMMNPKKTVLLADDNQRQVEKAVNFLAYIENLAIERARAAQSCPNYAEKFAQPSKLSPNFKKNGVIIEGPKAARTPKASPNNKKAATEGAKSTAKASLNTAKKGAIERAKKTADMSPQKGGLGSGSTLLSSPTSPEKFFCSNCNKCFPTHHALGGHRSSHNKVKVWIHNTNVDGMILKTDKKKKNNAEIMVKTNCVTGNVASPDSVNQQQVVQSGMAQAAVVHDHDENSHVCTVCGRGFASGQALGGHKRCHNSAATPDEEKDGTGEKTTNVRDFDLNEEPLLQED